MRHSRIIYGILPLMAALITSADSTRCNRVIDGVTMPNSIAEEKYHFFMTLFNRTEIVFAYMPNTKYSVTIQAESAGMIPRKFTRFLISAEPENTNETIDSGIFDLQDDSLSRFSDKCPNAVMETSKVPKQEISVAWTSPTEGSGCILIRATIMETPDTWYIDDSNLVLPMCQDSKAKADEQGPVLPECCACEEAKYEVTFEGLWSRNTHPKDFPSKGWLIRFSDVIGASHTVNYSFWKYGEMASVGLQQVAELGLTRKLEAELKNQSAHIRTIIKARGISYPNVTGKTFAVFRVDRKHHLMSLVSMIDPSPDWIVGVSGLELCLENASWIQHKELNLYPYDAGTDDGITYLSPDSPSDPQEPIRRITSSYPDDPRSPFYDPSGLDMKPLARLYLNRQRLYEKTCDNVPAETDSGGPPVVKLQKNKACRVTPWGTWGNCSVKCGSGYRLRQRAYRNETLAIKNNCTTSLTSREKCFGEGPDCDKDDRHRAILDSDMCVLEDWGPWSTCTTTCGKGSMTRSRNFQHKKTRKQCRIVPNGPDLQQTIDCDNDPCSSGEPDEVREGGDDEEDDNVEDEGGGEDYEREELVNEGWMQNCPEDRLTSWSLWSPCSSSCGPGFKVRSRYVDRDWSSLEKDDDDDDGIPEECKTEQAACLAPIPSCNFSKEVAEQICSEPMMKGSCEGNILRAYFDKQNGRCRLFSYSGCDGNRNNFPTTKDCNRICGDFQKKLEFKGIQTGSQVVETTEESIDCQVSKWKKWTPCERCRGYATSSREILVLPKGNGKGCPEKLERRKKCYKLPPCSLQADGSGRLSHRDRNTEVNEVSVDCKMTSWSAWSRCSTTCGESNRHRTRTVKILPRGRKGKPCPALVEFRKCPTVECP